MPKLKIYSPEGLADPSQAPTPITPLSSLRGRKVLALDNGKAGADILLTRLGEKLASRIHGEWAGIRAKGSAATPCEENLLGDFVREEGIVLTGSAD